MRRRHCITLNPDQPNKLLIELEHYKQNFNWDCGISCILMVLTKFKREFFINNFNKICKEEGFNTSTWTIDLCYLLKRFNVKYKFYTITIGIHPGYSGHTFYNNVYTRDETRITLRFKEAEQNNIKIKHKSINLNKIIKHLLCGPIIVLVNANLLTCDVCKLNKLTNELRKCLPWSVNYQGHYIVICGYQSQNNKIFYRNPSLSDRICVMSLDVLEDCRKCYGTDEDIIFIYK